MRTLAAMVIGIAMAAGSVYGETAKDKEAKALVSAIDWLQLCDRAQYDQTWDTSASYFQNAMKKQQWRQLAAAAREPLGKLVKRAVRSQEFRTTVPGGPDGEYVIFEFNTSFQKKSAAVETVTVMLDQQRGWRVAGYFIK